MSRHLVKSGFGCTLLTTDLGLTPERVAGLPGVEVVALPCLNRRYYLPWLTWPTISRLVQKADIIHLMNHWTVLNAVVYLAARRYRKPYVICPAGALKIFGRSPLLKRLYNLLVGRAMVRNASRFIAVSENEIPEYLRYGGKAERVVVIPNGINRADFAADDPGSFRRRHGLPANPLLLFVGRLNPIKGPDLLLEAFLGLGEEFGDYHLLLVGPDEGLRPELERLATRSGRGDRVHFLGYLGGEERSRAYHAAALLVIPSRQEAMSIVAVEAGICATPVLLTDQCGFPAVAEVGGGLVVAASAASLRVGLEELLADREELGRRGRSLQAYVEMEFSWETVIGKFNGLYRGLLAGNPASPVGAAGIEAG